MTASGLSLSKHLFPYYFPKYERVQTAQGYSCLLSEFCFQKAGYMLSGVGGVFGYKKAACNPLLLGGIIS